LTALAGALAICASDRCLGADQWLTVMLPKVRDQQG